MEERNSRSNVYEKTLYSTIKHYTWRWSAENLDSKFVPVAAAVELPATEYVSDLYHLQQWPALLQWWQAAVRFIAASP